MKPLVGITGRRLQSSVITHMDSRYAERDIDFYFTDYASKVAAAGGIPVLLPYEAGHEETVDRIDALIITGGQDVHPAMWGGSVEDASVPVGSSRTSGFALDADRDSYESALLRAAIDQSVPVLGICRGHQLLNVVRGGTLIPDLPPSSVEHYLTDAAPTEGRPEHVVSFVPGSLAHSLYGPTRVVNSWHHQAVDLVGSGLVVSGTASDEIVEAIELPGHPVLGVQWHPEWQVAPDPAFDWIVSTAFERQHVGSA
ncbi:putative glutamine amidotransferase [Rhodococcus sp. SMB37]|uniref:gamma-glutamyl-gamma-aminobutyrate hydrolase family protein n=1 Tax=Rhodococcus sp. SMB37 TaxID=2512213 RepID=UPI0010518353|nr:gamma-glutamyl-gamma-aminobutyrate hydrolase family protein [Rhodococcus sp. SMB37]TCN53388.1 putative glutamine amidotransferase [Rhodococcus sp. SMB37]